MTTLASPSPLPDAFQAQNGTSHGVREHDLVPKTACFGAEKYILGRENAPAVSPIPVAGPLLTIRLGLTPATIVLLAAPATVAIVMLTAWVILTSAGLPLYLNEMIGGAMVSAVGGMFASIPLFALMGKGAQMIAKAGVLSIAVRCSMILFGMILAMQPAWGLAKMPFVYWVLAYYFPMLMVETGLVAWLSVKAKY